MQERNSLKFVPHDILESRKFCSKNPWSKLFCAKGFHGGHKYRFGLLDDEILVSNSVTTWRENFRSVLSFKSLLINFPVLWRYEGKDLFFICDSAVPFTSVSHILGNNTKNQFIYHFTSYWNKLYLSRECIIGHTRGAILKTFISRRPKCFGLSAKDLIWRIKLSQHRSHQSLPSAYCLFSKKWPPPKKLKGVRVYKQIVLSFHE